MIAKEIRNMSAEDRQKELLELLKEQFKLRMQLKLGQLTRNHQLKRVRRDIARIKTINQQLEGANK